MERLIPRKHPHLFGRVQRPGRLPALASYGAAVLLVTLALIMSLAWYPLFVDNPFLLFVLAIAISAWVGGLRGGLLAAVITSFVANYFFPSPNTLDADLLSVVRLLVFVVVAAIISILYEVQRRTVDALYDNRQQALAVFESIADGFYILDDDLRYLYLNPKAEQMAGRARESLTGRKIWEVFPELEGTAAQRGILEAHENRRAVHFEIRSPILEQWVSVGVFPHPLGLSVYVRSIEAERQTQAERAALIQQLEAQNQLLATVLDQMPGGVIIAEAPSGTLIMANERSRELTAFNFPQGYSVEGYTSVQGFEGYAADGRKLETEDWPLMRALKTGAVIHGEEIDLHFVTGSQRAIRANAAPIRTPEGEIRAAVTIFHDITEHKRAVENLRDSELAYRSMFEENPHPMWVVRRDTLVMLASNQAAIRKYGYSDAEFAAMRLPDLQSETLEPALPPDSFAVQHKTRHGERLDVQLSARPLQFQGQDALLVLAYDETQRNRVQHRAQILYELMARLSESATPVQVAEAIVTHGITQLGAHLASVVRTNPAKGIVEILNVQSVPDDVLAKFQHLPLDAVTPLTDSIRRGEPVWLQTAEDYARLYPQLFAEAQPRTETQALIALPMNLDNRTIGAIGISFRTPQVFDPETRSFLAALAQQAGQALERARLYEVETAARQQAEQANRLKIQFLGMISHELRTPLASIKGFASTLLATDVSFSPKQQGDFVRIIDQEADVLRGLVDQLLDLARLQAGTFSVDPVQLEVGAVLEAASAQLQVLTHQHRLVRTLADNLPPVRADLPRIVQVIVNLVSNAAKFAPPHSTIYLNAKPGPSGVIIEICDEGPGIPAAQREIVFEAFRQGDDQRKGAGLGLAVCKGIVEAHGGRIWIENFVPQGTQVMFTLAAA